MKSDWNRFVDAINIHYLLVFKDAEFQPVRIARGVTIKVIGKEAQEGPIKITANLIQDKEKKLELTF